MWRKLKITVGVSASLILGAVLAFTLLTGAPAQSGLASGAAQPAADKALRPADAREYDNFGAALAVDGDWLAAGAPGVDLEAARNAGAVYLFSAQAASWQEVTRLTPEPAQSDARFGSTIAFEDGTLVVGAPYAYTPVSGNGAGAVYVFSLRGSEWIQEAYLTVSDGLPFDLFGGTLALQGDLLAVGARNAQNAQGQRGAGAVYVFQRSGTEWLLRAKLSASDGNAFDHFGYSLAFSGDDLLVGAPDYDHGEIQNSGLVYIFRGEAGSWVAHGSLSAQEIKPQARFGTYLNATENWLAVMAPQEYWLAGAMPPLAYAWESTFGAAHLYLCQNGEWSWQARLVPPVETGQEVTRPQVVLIKEDGDEASAALTGYGRGEVYVFSNAGGTWQAGKPLSVETFNLVTGGAIASREGQLLVGSHLQDLLTTNPVQAIGGVLSFEW